MAANGQKLSVVVDGFGRVPELDVAQDEYLSEGNMDCGPMNSIKSPRETVESQLRYLAKGLYSARDVAVVFELEISSSADSTLFDLAPPDVLAAMREDVAAFRQYGKWTLSAGGNGVDQTEAMRKFAEMMLAAGLDG